MPYINRDRQSDFEELVKMARQQRIDNPGELNYLFSAMVLEFLRQHGFNYTQMNAVVGVYECAKDEFQRQVLHPYENEKMKQNGNIFTDETPPATE